MTNWRILVYVLLVGVDAILLSLALLKPISGLNREERALLDTFVIVLSLAVVLWTAYLAVRMRRRM